MPRPGGTVTAHMAEPVSLFEVEAAWKEHPLGRHRAVGGRRALDGFHYQLALSLQRFFAALEQGQGPIETAFEGLGDLAQRHADTTYLVQVKTTLRRSSLRSAVDEMLAIDRFLEERFEPLRPRVRFAVWCRRLETQAQLAQLTAEELGLDAEAAERWRRLAARVAPVEVRPDPFLSLVVRHFDRLDNAFLTFEALLTRLLRLLARGTESPQIAEALLELWSQQRKAKKPPPGRLLTALHFLPAEPQREPTTVGNRPFLEDLPRGQFMPRPHRLAEVMTLIQGLWKETSPPPARRRLPVVWIDGAPGVGKSVLLLQVVEQLVVEYEGLVHALAPSADCLATALELWKKEPRPVILAVDDLYAPDQRQPEAWQRVDQAIFSGGWSHLPLILTCGPSDYRQAFERQARRSGMLRLESVVIGGLDDAERLAYGRWYGQRHGVAPPDVDERNFVTAAFLLHLSHHGQAPNLGQFAQRLADRFHSHDLYDDMLALLAAEILAVRVPPEAFSPRGDFVQLLLDEGILRRAGEPPSLRMMHPLLARNLYDLLVPQERLHERAHHIVRCFGLLRREPQGAELLRRLHSLDGDPDLDPAVRRRALEDLGELLHGTVSEQVDGTHVRLWLLAARDHTLRVSSRMERRLMQWLRQPNLDPAAWGQLWQAAWTLASPAEQPALAAMARPWLSSNGYLAEWNYVWQALWRHRNDDSLRHLALTWLAEQPRQAGWSHVFRALCQGATPDDTLRQLAVEGLRHCPVSAADPHLWNHVWRLGPQPWAFVDALLHRLARCPFPHLQKDGLGFLWRRRKALGDPSEIDAGFIDCLRRHRQVPMWAHLLQQPRLWQLPFDSLAPLVIEWLTENPERSEWHYLWRMMIDRRPDDSTLLNLARTWLDHDPEHASWAFVWQQLVDLHPGDLEILEIGAMWLQGRHQHPAWSHVWQRLVAGHSSPGDFIALARGWLEDGEGRSQWSYVWRTLLAHPAVADAERARLLDRATERLRQRPDGDQWPHIWRQMVTYRKDDPELWSLARQWLTDQRGHRGWAIVWCRVVRHRPEDGLLADGRSWLRRHPDNDAWPQAWHCLWDSPAEDDGLLSLGRRWLRRHPRHRHWHIVWQDLAVRLPWDRQLAQQAQAWLAAADSAADTAVIDQKALTAVRRRLQPMARLLRD